MLRTVTEGRKHATMATRTPVAWVEWCISPATLPQDRTNNSYLVLRVVLLDAHW
jgi:hypothetical protein